MSTDRHTLAADNDVKQLHRTIQRRAVRTLAQLSKPGGHLTSADKAAWEVAELGNPRSSYLPAHGRWRVATEQQGWACAMLLAVDGRDDYDYGWLFHLIDPDPAARGAALRRRDADISDWRDALDRCNEAYWANGGSSDFSDSPALGAASDQAHAAMREVQERSFSGILSEFITECRPFGRRDPTALRRLVPFAALFLQWEVTYPQDWCSPSPPWRRKKDVLRSLASIEVPRDSRAALVELVVAAVRREHRCEDRGYVLLARRLDGPDLRNMVAQCLDSPVPIVSLRASFLLDVLADPTMPATTASWKRWLASTAS